MSYEPSESYPVIVEVTTQHVVWVEADSAEEALRYAKDTAIYELIDDKETSTTFWDTVSLPTEFDWDTVYPRWGCDGSYSGRNANAHVEVHKQHLRLQEQAARRDACAGAGHPNRDAKPLADGRCWCPDCVAYLPAPVKVTS